MGRRAVLAGIAAAALFVSGTGATAARPVTCSFTATFTLSPGLSVKPNSGTFTSDGERGEMSCDGGAGTFGADGRYGTSDPDACFANGEGTAVQSWTIDVGPDRLHETNPITFTYGLLAAGAPISGRFQGPRFSGTFEVTPTKGDCVTAPVTEVSIHGKGTMH